MNLIKQIRLPNGRSTANLGFGCAGILRLPTAHRREHLLKTAFDEGITHFDVARMYGLGTAEGILGRALNSVRSQITLATKFGLPYATPVGFSLKIQSWGRWILNSHPALKSSIKKLASRRAAPTQPPAPANNYDISEMERSLGTSLHQLKTDWVDLFFIHEPGLMDVIPENMGEALQQQKAAGRIGAFGISAGRTELEYFLKTRPDLCADAVQYPHSVFKNGPGAEPPRHGFFGMFGVMNEALPPLDHCLAADQAFARSWSDRLGINLEVRENVGIVILAIALLLNPEGLVLFSTSNPKRLRSIVRRLQNNSFSKEDVLQFRQDVILRLHAN